MFEHLEQQMKERRIYIKSFINKKGEKT